MHLSRFVNFCLVFQRLVSSSAGRARPKASENSLKSWLHSGTTANLISGDFRHFYQKPMPVVVIVFLASFYPIEIYSQVAANRIDSLKRELNTNPADRFEVLWSLAYDLFDVDNAQAVIYAKEAYAFSTTKLDTMNMIRSGRIYGQLLRRLDQLEESVQVLEEVLLIARKMNYVKEMKLILNALAVARTVRAEYGKALEYHYESLLIREKEGDKKQISITLNNIGTIHYKLSNIDSALLYFMKSLKAKQEARDSFDLDHLYLNIGLCYNEFKDYKNSLIYFNKSFEVCGSGCSNQVIMEGEMGIGKSLLDQQQYGEAIVHLNNSYRLSLLENSRQYQLYCLYSLAKISLARSNLIEVDKYLKQIDRINESIYYKDILRDIYDLKAEYYTIRKDFERANFYSRKSAKLLDSLFSTALIKDLTRIQTKISQRENLLHIEAQAKIVALQEETVRQHRSLNLALAGLVLLAVGLIFTLYTINRQKQRINVVLDERVKERTRELEQHRDELRKLHEEKVIELKNVHTDILASRASLKGLTDLAFTESASVDENKKFYHDKIMEVINRLSASITHSPG